MAYDDDDDIPTVPCPYCREDILEDSEQCPRCGMYISKEDAPRDRKSWLWIAVMILALLATAFTMFG